MHAGENVFDQDCAECSADADHFGEDLRGMLEMVNGETADDDVELFAIEGEIADVGDAKWDIANAALASALGGDGEHGFGEIDTDDFAGGACKGFGNVSWAGGDIEDALAAVQVCGGDEALKELFVGDPGNFAAKAVACVVKASRMMSLCCGTGRA
jgi:hypothetical protein